jgi:hypothetical protein
LVLAGPVFGAIERLDKLTQAIDKKQLKQQQKPTTPLKIPL